MEYNSSGPGEFSRESRRLDRRSLSHACVVPLREFDRRRFRNIVVDDLSVTPDIAELLVPEGLFSVTFEGHKRIPGVRLSPDPIHQT